MRKNEMVGKAQTVLGPIDAESLGTTLPHEHLLADSTFLFVEPANDREKVLAHQPVGLKNLNWVLHHPFNNLDNLRLVEPLMRHKGISDEQIHTILVENPRRFLAFAPVNE